MIFPKYRVKNIMCKNKIILKTSFLCYLAGRQAKKIIEQRKRKKKKKREERAGRIVVSKEPSHYY